MKQNYVFKHVCIMSCSFDGLYLSWLHPSYWLTSPACPGLID